MTHAAATPPRAQSSNVTALIAAVARNTEAGGLRRFLELYRWKVLADYIRPVSHVRAELVIGQGQAGHEQAGHCGLKIFRRPRSQPRSPGAAPAVGARWRCLVRRSRADPLPA